ncbi:MAG: ABC transporter substrate-binding protein, partial [Desulfobacterales bacterium]|nr:ABC transporter substrate-binding protein [Desulfobacterales bacterium]
CKYAVETLAKKKIGIIYQNDEYGKNGLIGATEELKAHGLELTISIPLDVETSDIKPHVLQARKSEAEAILLWVSPFHAVRIVGTGKMMKFSTQWMTSSTCSDFPLMYSLSGGLWEGVIAATFSEFALSDVPDSPLMLKYKEAFKKFASKDERWSVFFWAGFGMVEPMIEAIKKCGKDLTRENFVKQMEGIKDFQGVAGKNITFKPFDEKDPSSRQGLNSVFLVQCIKDGGTKKLTDWMEFK